MLFNFILTQDAGKIIGPITRLLGNILDVLYNIFSNFGVVNIGVLIIIFTFVIRTLMIPLTIKQQKFAKMSSLMNPEISKIQKKYKGKKDPEEIRKQQTETQAVYSKYGVSPTAGCLPIFIQLPIMYGLFRVINNIPAYVYNIKSLYEGIVTQIMSISGFDTIISEFADEKKILGADKFDLLNNPDNVIDVLAKFNASDWNTLIEKFPTISNIIEENSAIIINANTFFGISIIDAPKIASISILIPLLAMLTQYITTKLMSNINSSSVNDDSPMASSMKTMNTIMPFLTGFFCLTFSAGIGLYWIAGSVFQIVQQIFVNRYMDKVDIEKLIEKNVDKINKRSEKLGIDPSKNLSQNLKATKQIGSYASLNKKEDSTSDKKDNTQTTKNNVYTGKPGSITANANLLRNKNYKDKGEK